MVPIRAVSGVNSQRSVSATAPSSPGSAVVTKVVSATRVMIGAADGAAERSPQAVRRSSETRRWWREGMAKCKG